MTKNGTIVSEYEYDPEGLRVVKKAKGQTIHYVFEGTEPIFEKNITTGKTKSYVYALGKHLARVDGVIGDPTAKVYWYTTDHLGSVKAVTDDAGKVVFQADHLAFGQRYNESGDFDEWHSFTGKEFDPETGLYYFNARWYDQETGRFISEDPVGDPNNPNLYTYCANNPLRFLDPSGLKKTTTTNDDGSKTVTETDRKGNVKKVTEYDKDGSRTSVTKYEKDGKTVSSQTNYTYKTEGDKRTVKAATQYKNGDTSTTTSEYRKDPSGQWVNTINSIEGRDKNGNRLYSMKIDNGQLTDLNVSKELIDRILSDPKLAVVMSGLSKILQGAGWMIAAGSGEVATWGLGTSIAGPAFAYGMVQAAIGVEEVYSGLTGKKSIADRYGWEVDYLFTRPADPTTMVQP